jgi:negative regulator of flagellin synthesis FlgM
MRNSDRPAIWRAAGIRSSTMKIGSFDNHNKLPAPANGTASPAATSQPAAEATVPDASTKVALSAAASLLVDDGNADFDAEKVARITQAIQGGKFKVNAEAIAARLIANSVELLSGRRP